MSDKHKFALGNKLGGNKKKPYKTIRINKNVPEDIHTKVMEGIELNVKEYLKALKKD